MKTEKYNDKKQQESWTRRGSFHITPEPQKYNELHPIQRFDSIQSDSNYKKKRINSGKWHPTKE